MYKRMKLSNMEKDLEESSSSTESEVSSDEEPKIPNISSKKGSKRGKMEESEGKSAFAAVGERQWLDRERVLLVCSRGISHQHRHFFNDLYSLLPHAKKEAKVERKNIREELDGLAWIRSTKNVLYLESRKRKHLYMWLGKREPGPTVKFEVTNSTLYIYIYIYIVDTCKDLRLTGNCLLGSRPLLSFDNSFAKEAHMKLIKELLVQTFNTPLKHPKSKPFIDHVLAFSYSDNKIWFRNYQVAYY